VTRAPSDKRGRTMVCLADVASRISAPMVDEDLAYLLRADAGEAEAQNDMGQLFLLAARYEAACFWFKRAAEQGHSDAMQWLACCYLAGHSVPRDENLALMWLARAAAHGSTLAKKQMQSMRVDGLFCSR